MKTLISLILIEAFLFVNSSAAYAKDKGWILTQHSKILGDQYIYISANGVKCINPKQSIGWVTQTPHWNITFFNEKTKLYYPLSAASWKKKIVKNGLLPRNINWSKISSGSIAGLKASEYKMVNSPGVNDTASAKWLSATYWLADEINVPKSLAQLISNTCGLPSSDSIPLELSYRNQRGNLETLLTTYHQQATAIPDSFFSIPSGYKMAKSEVEVLVSKENKVFIDELANDLKTNTSNNSQLITPQDINKLPDQFTLPNGRTINKSQINKFLGRLKQGE